LQRGIAASLVSVREVKLQCTGMMHTHRGLVSSVAKHHNANKRDIQGQAVR
jgi:hypothetical protein